MEDIKRLENDWSTLRDQLTEARYRFDFVSSCIIEFALSNMIEEINRLRKLNNVPEEKVYFLCV